MLAWYMAPRYDAHRSLGMKNVPPFLSLAFVIPAIVALRPGAFLSAANAGDPKLISVCTEVELRQAVESGGQIQFGCSGVITLSGTIEIVRDVTLDGGGMSVTISGGSAVRLFKVASNVTFEARNLILADGWHQGTNGWDNGSEQTATNGEDAFGGAVYNAGGTFRLISCVLSNNAALGGKGGDKNGGSSVGVGGAAMGGAIFCKDGGTAHIESSLLVSNRAAAGTGGILIPWDHAPGGAALGGALAGAGCRVFVTNSEFRGNLTTAPAGGSAAHGGALGLDEGEIVLVKSSLLGNRSSTAIVQNGPGGAGPGSAFGGALHLGNATGTVARSIFNFNAAEGGFGRYSSSGDGFGGAIHSLGDLRVSDSTFIANTAQGGVSKWWRGVALGGGIFNGGTLALSGTTFASNEVRGGLSVAIMAPPAPGGDAAGGGVYNAGSVAGTNCTLAFNRSVSGSEWSYTDSTAYGGGAFNSGPAMTWVNVTLASNVTEQGYRGLPSQGANLASTNGVVRLRNSLLAFGTGMTNLWPLQPQFAGLIANGSGIFTDEGNNLSTDFSCGFTSASSLSGVDPLLGPLSDNGGPTRTMALLPGSPAINAATFTGAPSTDQRGSPRPAGAANDIGAYEASPPSPPLVGARTGSFFQLSFNGLKGFGYELQSSSDLVNWSVLETIPPLLTSETVTRQFPVSGQVQLYRLQTK